MSIPVSYGDEASDLHRAHVTRRPPRLPHCSAVPSGFASPCRGDSLPASTGLSGVRCGTGRFTRMPVSGCSSGGSGTCSWAASEVAWGWCGGVGDPGEDEFDERMPSRLRARPSRVRPRFVSVVVWRGRQPARLSEPPAHRPHRRDHRRAVAVRPAKLRDHMGRRLPGGEPPFRLTAKHGPRIRAGPIPRGCRRLHTPQVRRERLPFTDSQHPRRQPHCGEPLHELPS